MEIDVRSDIKAVLDMLNDGQKNAVPKAAARALNKTITTINAAAARQIKSRFRNGY
jgi:hypothetical protein